MASIGQRFGEFEVVAPVARGGAGEVWRAKHVRTGGLAAVKVLHEPDDASWDNEVDALTQIRHPGVVPVFDAGIVGDERWIASAWMSGGTLRARAVKDWHQLRDLLVAVLDALAFAHASGVLHRDLKPENILRHEGTWCLADFGIARFMDRASWSRPRGTPFYAAPEQIAGDVHNQRPWTDLYSLACVAWEQLTGAPPFLGSLVEVLHAHAESDPPPLKARFDIPPGFETWMRVLLRKEGRRRAQFAADAKTALLLLGPPVPGTRFVSGPVDLSADTVDLDAFEFESVDDPPTEPPLMPPAPLPSMPDLTFRPAAPEIPLARAVSSPPIVPIGSVFQPLWQRLHHAHRTGRAQVVWHEGRMDHRLQATWVTLWASAYGQPGASLKGPTSVRAYLRHAAGGTRSLVEGVQSWARCSRKSAVRMAAALGDDAPYDAKTLAEFLGRVARERGLVIHIDGIDRDPERLQLAAALCGAKAPMLVIAHPESKRTPVPGASELAPVLVDESVLADWLVAVAPIDRLTAQTLARGRTLGEAWEALCLLAG